MQLADAFYAALVVFHRLKTNDEMILQHIERIESAIAEVFST